MFSFNLTSVSSVKSMAIFSKKKNSCRLTINLSASKIITIQIYNLELENSFNKIGFVLYIKISNSNH